MNIYLDLFCTFAKVGVCTFGGGYAMLPILQREVVQKKGWATDAELTAVMFDTLLGDDLNARKAFIAAHGAEYMKTADI